MIKRYKIVSNKRAFSSLQFNLTIEDNVASDDLQLEDACEGAGQEERSLVFLDEIGENHVFVLVQETNRAALDGGIEGERVAVQIDFGNLNGGLGMCVTSRTSVITRPNV